MQNFGSSLKDIHFKKRHKKHQHSIINLLKKM